MSSLIVTAYKPTQKEGVVLNEARTVRQKNAESKRASIMVTSLKHSMRNGAVWTEKRVANITLPVELANSLNPVEGEDLNPKLKALFGVDHTIQMVEQTTEFYAGQSPKTKGQGGETVVNADGEVVFQDYRVVPMDADCGDIRESRPMVTATTAAPVQTGDLAGG